MLDNPEYYSHLFWLHRQRQEGYLPEPGGLNDQPYKLIHSFRVIDSMLSRIEEHRKEEEDRKNRLRNPRPGRGGPAGGTKSRPRPTPKARARR